MRAGLGDLHVNLGTGGKELEDLTGTVYTKIHLERNVFFFFYWFYSSRLKIIKLCKVIPYSPQ